MTQLFDTTTVALRGGLTFAASQLLLGDQSIDADQEDPRNYPLDLKAFLLDRLARRDETGFTEDELRRHGGRKPIPADRKTHEHMMHLILTRHPVNCFVVGEEATDEEWDAAEAAGPGAIIFTIDAIDGSLPYEALTFGYGTTLLVHVRREEGYDELLLAAVANSSGFVAIWEESTVSAGTLNTLAGAAEPSLAVLPEPLADPVADTHALAILGATPRHRERIGAALEDDSTTVFTTGGAPAALGLIVGKLTALASTKGQTLHDAAFLPIVARLEIPIYGAGGIMISETDILRWFRDVGRNDANMIKKPIPPFVVSRDPGYGLELAQRLELGLEFPKDDGAA